MSFWRIRFDVAKIVKFNLGNQIQLWQYGLSGFQAGDTKLERFLPKNQHSQKRLLNFENWCKIVWNFDNPYNHNIQTRVMSKKINKSINPFGIQTSTFPSIHALKMFAQWWGLGVFSPPSIIGLLKYDFFNLISLQSSKLGGCSK